MNYNIYLEGTVGYSISSPYVKWELDKYKGKHVDVRLSSLGGDVVTALNIYTLFKEHGDVTVYLVGAAASAATIIAMGAKEIKIDSSCMFLVHKCSGTVFEWGQMNEEQLQQLIENLKKQAQDQKTIDGIIANVYSKRNGKTMEENIKIMAEGAWLNAEKAKEYGLVDTIFEIEEGQEKTLSNQYRNSISLNNGVENPPVANAEEKSSVVDAEGEPTESFVQKTLDKISSLFHGKASNEVKKMFKAFSVLNALFGVESLESHEDNVIITQDQAKKVEDEITSLRDHIAEKDNSISTKDDEIKTLNDQIAEKDMKIKEFEDAVPAAETHDVHENENDGEGTTNLGRELFNNLKNV